jgi:hypothetical protein
VTPYWYIHNDFFSARSKRIGASEISALIPNPEKPNESLAGTWRRPDGTIDRKTAVTVWEEKTGRREPSPSGLPAEMGHWNEVKALELFIRGIDPATARAYRESRLRYEMLAEEHPEHVKAEDYQATPFRHNTQWYDDNFIVHPDGIYEPDFGIRRTAIGTMQRIERGRDPALPQGFPYEILDEQGRVTAHGYTIDLSEPFLLEAKTASYWSAKRRNGSLVSGYDFDLATWQGIPLKHYVQIQFQLACMDVETAYLPLLYDSASFHVWQIARDRAMGDKLIDLAGRFAWHIKHDEPPKEMAMNALDIAALYPELREDFRFVSDEAEREALIEAARAAQKAAAQEKTWKRKKEDASDALAVLLRDSRELKIELDGEIVPVVKWIEKKGGELVAGLKEAKAIPGAEDALRKLGLVKQGEGSRYVSVTLKEEEEKE